MSCMREKMHTGELYPPDDAILAAEQTACLDRLYDYNRTRPTEGEKRTALLKEMFAEIGEGCYIEPPFHANWGGKHCHFGKNVYANFNLTCVDDTDIFIGDNTMFGPNVTVAVAGHPILPELRRQAYQYNAPVHIGENCWIGAGAVLLPGVTVGDHTVIGAGSVVTRDIPAGVVAVGNPCRVLRPIGEHDRVCYFRGKKLPPELGGFAEKTESRISESGAVEIREAVGDDAERILAYCRAVGAESENLTFGAEGIPMTPAKERDYLDGVLRSPRQAYFVALAEGEIVGAAVLSTPERERLRHRGEISISVRRDVWGQHIGTRLMERLLAFAREVPGLEMLSLEVRSDNVRAIALYRKFGFEKTGTFRGFMKIGGREVACDTMVCRLTPED